MHRHPGPFRERLLDWYERVRRPLPWRRDADPYRVWISEVMLQQTRVEVVIPYFERFVGRFQSVRALAEAAEAEVLAAWSGLGYYSRGRRLHAAARAILERHAGRFPSQPAQVRRLPGIGAYTAGAVLSIAFGQREPAVDGNVQRVLARVAGLDADPRCGPGLRAVRALAERLVPADRPGEFNQALMELGATVCTPRSPRCPACPVRTLCEAGRSGRPETLVPREAPRPRTEAWLHVAALVRQPQRGVLLVQRPAAEAILPGLWHLPGLFLPEAEAATALHRLGSHVRESLGCRARVGSAAGEARHQITYRRIRAIAYETELSGAPPAQGRWTLDPRADDLATSSLLDKLLASASRPRQLELL